ncbi:MAG: response regulator [Bacteroidales bacterium]|nr:MAG: response regulator [Bacteroidales bacterium]
MFKSFLISCSKGLALPLILYLLINTPTNSRAEDIISPDSINKVLSQSSDSSRLELLIKSANDYNNSNTALSIEYARIAIALAKKFNSPNKQVIAEIIIGKALFINGEYANAIEQLEKSQALTLSINDSINLIEINRIYALIYTKIGDFKKAIEYSEKTFTLVEKLNQQNKLADIVRETGNIYYSFREYGIALDFYQKSLTSCQAKNDQVGMSKALNNIGQVYIDLGQYSKALDFLNRSLEIKSKYDNKLSYTITQHNIGIIYFRQKDYSKAISYFTQSNRNYTKINYIAGITDSYQFLGQSYLKIKQYKFAEESLLEAEKLAEKAQIRTLLVTIYLSLSELYAETNRFNEAYIALSKNKALSDSLYSDEKRNLLIELDAKYNLQTKEKQIKLLSKEQELENIQRKKLTILSVLLAFTAFFLILIIYLIYSRMRFRGRINRQLLEEINQRKIVEEELHRHQDHLEALVDDRTKDLKIAKDKAEESDMLKTAFLANMSHEIRTPMNAIVGFSNLLEHETLPEERMEYVKQINSNADILMNLINDIIDISMIESGQIKTNITSVSISALLNELLALFEMEKHKINKSHISIMLDYNHNLESLEILTDSNRLKQVLSNIISNALKFTHKGSIVIGFKQNNPYKTLFFVKDTGIGIAPCNEEAIFERFSKFNSEPEAMLFPGTGLGLTICRELIHLLGGNIWFDSVINEGSTFYFTLPTKNPEQLNDPNIKNMTKLDLELDLTGKTIIVAEDAVSNFKLIKAFLKLTNVNLLWAKDGKEVMEMLEKQIVHLILMDIQMPLMDGIQTTKEIRMKENSIPIIIQTAYTLNNEKDKSYAVGCNDYITKPIKREELIEKISKYI